MAVSSPDRVQIGIFGRCNAGKSSLMNAILGQDMAIVSEERGTTTDPVRKTMELLPLGPVVMIDTPGLDDVSQLGDKRTAKTRQILRQTDIAVLVMDAADPRRIREMQDGLPYLYPEETDLLEEIEKYRVPSLLVMNKADVLPEETRKSVDPAFLFVSALTGEGIHGLKELIAHAPVDIMSKESTAEHPIIRDLITAGDLVVLVTPIDEAAPKGRMILPIQATIRDILDAHAVPVVTQPEELSRTLAVLQKADDAPALVVTDSQAFEKVSAIVPDDISLTSFSILMARHKGDLEWQLAGAGALDTLENGAAILISEGCTHHRQCGDIGTQKIPEWIRKYTGKDIAFDFTSGGEYPDDLSGYALIVHCGGCMLNKREMQYRIRAAKEAGVPITNYGMLIAKVKGILDRTIGFLRK